MKLGSAKCIVHCGTEKTGSTTLQRFLAMHAGSLRDQLIWVPRSLVYRPDVAPYNHIKVSTASRLSVNRPDDLQRMLGCKDMTDVARHREEVAADLQNEYHALDFVPETIIISNEHIHSRLRNVEDLVQLKNLLSPYCQEFSVVVYLRDQLGLANSLATTSLRNGKSVLRFVPDFTGENGFDPVLGTDFSYFDYAAFLSRLEQVFSFDHMKVRLYEEIFVDKMDIVDSFFDDFSIKIANLSRSFDENVGLNRLGALLFAELNKVQSEDSVTADSVKRAKTYLEEKYKGKIPVYLTPQAQAFSDLYEESNEFVRAKWFPSRKKLFMSSYPRRDVHPVQNLSMADILLAVVEMAGLTSKGSGK